MTEINYDASVDVTDMICPITFVKAKVAIEGMESGQYLKLRINEGEAMQNVSRSMKDEGHRVVEVRPNGDGTFIILVKKDGRGTSEAL